MLVILVNIVRRLWNGTNRSRSDINDARQPLLPTVASQGSLISKGSSPEEFQAGEGRESEKESFRIAARVISDATIGLSDGLTVPFALSAGLSALGNAQLVIYAGLAELIAGAISMGLGGYLGAKSEAAAYKTTLEKTRSMIRDSPQKTMDMINKVFKPYQLPLELQDGVTTHLLQVSNLDEFLMKSYHCEKEPNASRPWASGFTIAMGYLLGGFLPLLPYFFSHTVQEALIRSIVVMLIALFVFGYGTVGADQGWKGGDNIRAGLLGGGQMVLVGGFATGSAMLLVKLLSPEGQS